MARTMTKLARAARRVRCMAVPHGAEGFLRAVNEKMSDQAPRLIFADWLQDHGDPRHLILRGHDPTSNSTLFDPEYMPEDSDWMKYGRSRSNPDLVNVHWWPQAFENSQSKDDPWFRADLHPHDALAIAEHMGHADKMPWLREMAARAPERLARAGRPVRCATRDDIAGLHQMVVANPHDRAPWLVLADALDEMGKPHTASALRLLATSPDSHEDSSIPHHPALERPRYDVPTSQGGHFVGDDHVAGHVAGVPVSLHRLHPDSNMETDDWTLWLDDHDRDPKTSVGVIRLPFEHGAGIAREIDQESQPAWNSGWIMRPRAQMARGGRMVKMSRPIDLDPDIVRHVAMSPEGDHAPWLVLADHMEESGLPLTAQAVREGTHEGEAPAGHIGATGWVYYPNASGGAHGDPRLWVVATAGRQSGLRFHAFVRQFQPNTERIQEVQTVRHVLLPPGRVGPIAREMAAHMRGRAGADESDRADADKMARAADLMDEHAAQQAPERFARPGLRHTIINALRKAKGKLPLAPPDERPNAPLDEWWEGHPVNDQLRGAGVGAVPAGPVDGTTVNEHEARVAAAVAHAKTFRPTAMGPSPSTQLSGDESYLDGLPRHLHRGFADTAAVLAGTKPAATVTGELESHPSGQLLLRKLGDAGYHRADAGMGHITVGRPENVAELARIRSDRGQSLLPWVQPDHQRVGELHGYPPEAIRRYMNQSRRRPAYGPGSDHVKDWHWPEPARPQSPREYTYRPGMDPRQPGRSAAAPAAAATDRDAAATGPRQTATAGPRRTVTDRDGPRQAATDLFESYVPGTQDLRRRVADDPAAPPPLAYPVPGRAPMAKPVSSFTDPRTGRTVHEYHEAGIPRLTPLALPHAPAPRPLPTAMPVAEPIHDALPVAGHAPGLAGFRYEAMDTSGNEVSGHIHATDHEAAHQHIKQMGLFATRVEPAAGQARRPAALPVARRMPPPLGDSTRTLRGLTGRPPAGRPAPQGDVYDMQPHGDMHIPVARRLPEAGPLDVRQHGDMWHPVAERLGMRGRLRRAVRLARPVSDVAGLIGRIHGDEYDQAPHLILADYLTEHGMPAHAELVTGHVRQRLSPESDLYRPDEQWGSAQSYRLVQKMALEGAEGDLNRFLVLNPGRFVAMRSGSQVCAFAAPPPHRTKTGTVARRWEPFIRLWQVSHPDDAAAADHYQRLLSEGAVGFLHVGGEGAVENWPERWITGPVRRSEYRFSMSGRLRRAVRMSRANVPGLWEAVKANPHDDAPWLILADALDEAGKTHTATLMRQLGSGMKHALGHRVNTFDNRGEPFAGWSWADTYEPHGSVAGIPIYITHYGGTSNVRHIPGVGYNTPGMSFVRREHADAIAAEFDPPHPERLARVRLAREDDPGLLRAIAANPWDDGPHLVLADSLEEQGSPFGHLIREYATGRRQADYWNWRDTGPTVPSSFSPYHETDNPQGYHRIGAHPPFALYAVPSGFGGDPDTPLLLSAVPLAHNAHSATPSATGHSRAHYNFELLPHDVADLARQLPGEMADRLLFAARQQWHRGQGYLNADGETFFYDHPSYDEIVSRPRPERMARVHRYPLASRKEWDADRKKPGGRLAWMKPDDFLAAAPKLEVDDKARAKIDSLKAHMGQNGRLPPLMLGEGDTHDGRHRAHAAREMGVSRVPVVDYRPARAARDGPPARLGRERLREAVQMMASPYRGRNSWFAWDTFLGRRQRKVAGNNRWFERNPDGSISVVLHSTPVVTAHQDGTYTLRSGGWRTVTTRQTINDFSPARVSFAQRGGTPWFYDGVKVDASGVPLWHHDGRPLGRHETASLHGVARARLNPARAELTGMALESYHHDPEFPEDERAHLGHILQSPEDDAPWLVYADHLREKGHRPEIVEHIERAVPLAPSPDWRPTEMLPEDYHMRRAGRPARLSRLREAALMSEVSVDLTGGAK